DSWGKCIAVTNASGEACKDNTVAVQNSIRYRGYVYDKETELYYLQSRYYDPEVCRFINSDDVNFIGATGTVGSYNAFAYCENNPINLIDQNGEFAKWIYNKFKTFKNNIVGIGIQFECSASALGASVGMGVEVIYFTHLKTIKVYAYSPKGIYFDKDDLSKLFNVAKKQLGKPQNLFKSSVSGSVSVSAVVIYSSKGKKFKTDDYLYDFKTYSFTIKYFQCFYSKGSDCIAVGAGGTISSSIVNVSASTSKSYYVYANQFFNYIYSSFQNCYNTIKNYANKAIINRK
ncbi:MAG: RHS repeat-associated core domain-containing protein, partial [Clostridia bacterium]|nr:RHS repeat-associated core domain-containing protein [Clostridia bacterium]